MRVPPFIIGALVCLFPLICVLQTSARAQAPTGIIAGVVSDHAGAHVAGARIHLTNRDSGLSRSVSTSSDGDYLAPALPPGTYRVRAEVNGFQLSERVAAVEAGTITTVNIARFWKQGKP